MVPAPRISAGFQVEGVRRLDGPMAQIEDITSMLALARQGDSDAIGRLYPVVYQHLRSLAGGYFRSQRPDQTLQATALVHEAYLKLIDQTASDWRDREHFFAVAAKAMRHILIDHARARAAGKRGKGWGRIELDSFNAPASSDAPATDSLELLAVDRVLTALSEIAPRQAQVVELRFFAGLSVDQIARVLEVSPRTVDFDWKLARAWLARALSESSSP
jgi:RNA polymerase sigma factor (TIGR02999 family)